MQINNSKNLGYVCHVELLKNCFYQYKIFVAVCCLIHETLPGVWNDVLWNNSNSIDWYCVNICELMFGVFSVICCSVTSVCAGSTGHVWDCMRTACQTTTAATSAETHQVKHHFYVLCVWDIWQNRKNSQTSWSIYVVKISMFVYSSKAEPKVLVW